MLKIAFVFITALHGLIHLMGVVKAFGLASIPQITTHINRNFGMIWLLASIMFLVGAWLVYTNKYGQWWQFILLMAVILSQYVITFAWNDAKFATLPNVLILLVLIASYLTKKNYLV